MKFKIHVLTVLFSSLLIFSCSDDTQDDTFNLEKEPSSKTLGVDESFQLQGETIVNLTDAPIQINEKFLINLNNNIPAKNGANVLGAMVEMNSCRQLGGPPGEPNGSITGIDYNIYAHAGGNMGYKPYDRLVELYVVKIVDGVNSVVGTRIVTIPANDGASNSVSIFRNLPYYIGSVRVMVANVQRLDTNQFDNSAQFLTTTHQVDNCYYNAAGEDAMISRLREIGMQ